MGLAMTKTGKEAGGSRWHITYGCSSGAKREWFDVFAFGDHKARVYIKLGNRKDAEALANRIAALPELEARIAALDTDNRKETP